MQLCAQLPTFFQSDVRPLPEKCVKVEARLLYQSASWEYIKFLAEENRTNDWGKRLYEGWKQTGKCEPVVMASITKEI